MLWLKKEFLEIENIIAEIKNSAEGLKGRVKEITQE